jgi:hypothetical protein
MLLDSKLFRAVDDKVDELLTLAPVGITRNELRIRVLCLALERASITASGLKFDVESIDV